MQTVTSASVRERPILFSGDMVRAILEGRKSQTRRVVKRSDGEVPLDYHDEMFWFADGDAMEMPCPFGQPGDRLWVRETLQHGARNNPAPRHNHVWRYAADNALVVVPEDRQTEMLIWATHKEGDVCVSIHMPRWASRLTLEITKVRVERVQEISQQDIFAEGLRGYLPEASNGLKQIAVDSYRTLWDRINAKRGFGWDANPWVWVVDFAVSFGKPAEVA